MPRKSKTTIATTIYLLPEIYRALKQEAALRRLSVTAIILEALENRYFKIPRN